MAKGFQCDKCGTWHKGGPALLTDSVDAYALKVETADGALEFHGGGEVKLSPTTWRGTDFCRKCVLEAQVEVLSQWIQLLQKKKEA